MGLDVDVFRTEQFRCSVDCELFDFVGVLTAAVVSFAGVALGVLVRQRAALGIEDGLAHVILAGDHLQRRPLTVNLVLECVGDVGIDLPNLIVFHIRCADWWLYKCTFPPPALDTLS